MSGDNTAPKPDPTNPYDSMLSESMARRVPDPAAADAANDPYANMGPDLPLGSEVPVGGQGYKVKPAPPPKPLPMVTAPDGQQYDANNAEDLKHLGGMAARVVVHTVNALPGMAEDLGVGVRNALLHENTRLPTQDVEDALDRYFGKPQGAEKATDILGPMVLGASATGLPGALRTVAGGATPELGTRAFGTAGPLASSTEAGAAQVNPNTLTPDQTKAQFTANVLKKWQEAGGVVPPSTTNPTISNIIGESVAGKIKTQQGASIKNEGVIDQLAQDSLPGFGSGGLSPKALAAYRAEQGRAYAALSRVPGRISTGEIDSPYWSKLTEISEKYEQMAHDFPGSTPPKILDDINSLAQENFTAKGALQKIIDLRDKASVAGQSGDRGTAADYKALATNLEDQIDSHISSRTDIPQSTIANFRAARKNIAMAHSVEDALVGEHVSAKELANSGDPLSGNLKLIADMYREAEKGMQLTGKMGSPVSHLDSVMTGGLGYLGAHESGNVLGAMAGAAWPVGRWAAKTWLLSPRGQVNAIPADAIPQGPMSARSAALAQALATFQSQPSQQGR